MIASLWTTWRPQSVTDSGTFSDEVTRARRIVQAASIAQCLTIGTTWKLWNHRPDFPNLAVVHSFAEINWPWFLIASSILTAIVPRVGSPTFAVVLTGALLGDQMRLQPEVVTLAVLMFAPLLMPSGMHATRWLLASVWIWSGLHKMLSVGWRIEGGGFIADAFGLAFLTDVFVVLVPVVEIAIGIAALFQSLRPVARWGGAAMHIGILITLAVFARTNSAIWPWNAALAIVAISIFAPSRPQSISKKTRAIAITFLMYPALFYVGAVDAYLSSNLYSFNTATAEYCSKDVCRNLNSLSYDKLNTPFPPEPRLFKGWFHATCKLGDTLLIEGRAGVLDQARSETTYSCTR